MGCQQKALLVLPLAGHAYMFYGSFSIDFENKAVHEINSNTDRQMDL